MSPEDIKQYNDPLMGRVDKKQFAGAIEKPPRKSNWPVILGTVGLVAVLATVIYFLYQAQQRIEALNADLTASRRQLETVSTTLDESRTEIGALQEDLVKSQTQIGSQRREISQNKKVVSDLKSRQGEQTRELEAISIRKADQSQVEALKDETAVIQQDVGEINSRIAQVNSNISDLREQSTRNRGDIDNQEAQLTQLQQKTAANADEIAGVKRSLDREYYNFELQKKGGVMKVFDVALSLKDTDFKGQRFTMEILTEGRRMKKKNQNINEPIYFYVKDLKKPYEVRVNRVDKNFVVGYLSVPKG